MPPAIARLVLLALLVTSCGSEETATPPPEEPSEPARYRGYAAIQADLYRSFVAPNSTVSLLSASIF